MTQAIFTIYSTVSPTSSSPRRPMNIVDMPLSLGVSSGNCLLNSVEDEDLADFAAELVEHAPSPNVEQEQVAVSPYS